MTICDTKFLKKYIETKNILKIFQITKKIQKY